MNDTAGDDENMGGVADPVGSTGVDAGQAGGTIDIPPVEGATVTPLAVLRPHLSSRIYNMLTGAGFTTVEQIAVRDDLALMDIRLMGLSSINAIREAIATVRADGIPVIALHLEADQAHELVWLLTTLSAYADGQGSHDVARRADAFLLGLSSRPAASSD